MKKILAFLLALSLLSALLPAALAADVVDSGTWENITWKLTSDGTLTISGTGNMPMEYSGDAPWIENGELIKKAVIKSGVTNITVGAFYECHNLSSITIPSSVTRIESLAFYECTSLTSFTIPETVTYVESDAFYRCLNLTKITVAADNPAYCSKSGVLFDKDCKTLVTYPIAKSGTSYVIPSGVTKIANAAFANCTSLTSITIPASVKTIESWAFLRCAISSIAIPPGVKAIEELTFYGCENLTSITIPASVTSVGEEAFDECGKLKNVYYEGTSTEWGKISIGESNAPLTKASIHYNSSSVKITTQPKSVTVAKAGDTATVKVVASGEGLSYAWYYKDTTMSSFKKGSIETASYSIAVTAARNGRQLYCVVTGKDGYTAKSNTVTISIASAIVITKQPADVTVAKAGDTAKVPITATGTSLKYTWYVKDPGASSFSKSSVTSSTYSFSVTAVKSGRQVYCVVSDANGGSVKSNTATVKIAETLKITKQPADVAVAKAGTTANVPITATGTGLKYTWYVKDPGATSFSKSSITSSTYSFSVTEAKNGRQIYCIVSDTAGNSMKSSTATVTICAKITTQPKSVTVSKEGDTATVKVTASGDGLKYEWWYKNSGMTAFKKGSITTATYSVAVTSARNGRQLYCKISDKYGNSVTTNIVTIKVG